jgi:NHL repeat
LRAQAQGLSSAANSDGSAPRGPVFGRRDSVTRASSLSADGSGAPSHRRRLTVLALAIAAFALLAFAPLSQAKVVVNGFGTPGTLGGEFGNVGGIAVNNSGNGAARGTTYVVDSQARVQRFTPAGAFSLLWGRDVIATTVNERQLVTVNASAGTYRLTFNGQQTVDLPYNAGAALVDDALDALPTIGGDANVAVTGTPAAGFTIAFQGTLAGANQPQLLATTVLLTGTVAIKTTVEGADAATTGGSGTDFEICRVATHCKAGTTTGTTANNGQLNNPQGVAVNGANGHVYVTENGNRRVSEFDADGVFVRAWGWDVDGTLAGTGFEVCPAANSCKQAAAAGVGTGQFGGAVGYPTVDSSNNVWVPDQTNKRIQVFDASGNFVKMVGGDVITNGATGTGTLNASTSVTAVTTTSKFFEVGQTVTASDGGIPAGTTIVSCSPAANSSGTCLAPTSLTLSQSATTSGPVTLTAAAGAGNAVGNEAQTITVTNAVQGKFSLAFNGRQTGAVSTADWGPQGSLVLRNVTVSSGTFAVGMHISTAFSMAPASTEVVAVDSVNRTITVDKISLNNNPLSGGAVVGHDLSPAASAATIQAALEGLTTIGAGNVSVTGPNGGPWAVEFTGRFAGADVPQLVAVAANGESRTVSISSANPFEVCAVPADCRAGAPGSGAGQFDSTFSAASDSPRSLAFDSSGNLFVIDPGNRRVQKFNTSLTTAADFGAGTLFPAFTTSAPEAMVASQGGTRLDFAVNNSVVGERQIVQLDPADASVKDTSLVGSGLNEAIAGLGADDGTGTLYATTDAAASPRKVLALRSTPAPAPVPAVNPVTAKTATTATLSGTVDPTGGLVSCAFQYSTDPAFPISSTTSVAAPGCSSLASSGAQAVSVNVTGLIPNSHYFVRLTASRPLVVPTTTTTSSATVFDTDSVPPAVSNVGAIEIADTSARLVGTIDPKHSATGYVFQYGTTPALGSSTPSVDIGAGSTPLIVSQQVQGLTPATTYYFRLVATNDFGTVSSNNKTLLTRTDPVSPDARAYEMVSPVDKNGGGALSGGQRGWSVAYDGEGVGFCTTAMFGDPSSPLTHLFDACAHYASQRGADGWQTRAVIPPVCQNPFSGGATEIKYSRDVDYLVMSRAEPECPLPPLDPAAQLGRNLYREDLLSTPAAFDLLTPRSGRMNALDTRVGSMVYVASSPDFSHVVYQSDLQQTLDAPAGLSLPYEWDNGTLRLVSISPAGTPFTTTSGLAGGDPNNGISANGERIFFSNRGPGFVPQEIYMREGGTVTHRVSQTECTVSCPAGLDTAARDFRYATPDGSRVFFTTSRKIANDDNTASGADLYMYTHSTNPVSDRNLSVVSIDSEPADGTATNFIGMLGASDDGETAYFVADGQLVLGAPTAAGPKVYRWRRNGGDPRLDYLATLNSGDGNNWGVTSAQIAGVRRSVTPSGQYLLILTALALDSVADTDSSRDFYRWDARSGWLCVSCQRPGVASAGDVEGRDSRGRVSSNYRDITMSDDGQRIFFATADALVPEDTNGLVRCPLLGTVLQVPTCQDVYEWHDGKISLLTIGTSSSPSYLLGASHDGQDVFFYSEDRLVGWDTDIVGDIYDARIGGGFPPPPEVGVPCDLNSGACEGAPSVAPPVTGAGSAAFEGPGNERRGFRPNGRRCPRGKRKVSRNGRTRCVPRKTQAQRKNRTANHNRRAAR